MRTSRGPFLVALLFAAGRATAQQLIVNPSFDSDLSSWAPAGVGSSNQQTTTFYTAPGAAHLTNNLSSGDTELSQCVAITPGASYNWGAWSYVPTGTDGFNQAQVYWCTTSACTTCNFSAAGVSSTLTNTWEKLMTTGSLAPASGAPFGKLVLRGHANSTTTSDFHFDEGFLGVGITPVALQRFSAD